MIPCANARARTADKTFAGVLALTLSGAVSGQFGANYRGDPIRYGSHAPDDRITKLQASIERGEVRRKHDRKTGYLASLLAQLRVPPASQNLIFSKTSFQIHRISPDNPRADPCGNWISASDCFAIPAVTSSIRRASTRCPGRSSIACTPDCGAS